MAKFEKGSVPAGAVPFQPGQSGNPAGRPVGSRNRATVLRRLLDTPTAVTLTEGSEPEPGTLEDALAVALLRRALSGDVRAFREVMDSVYGKNVERVETTAAVAVMTVAVEIITTPGAPPIAHDENDGPD